MKRHLALAPLLGIAIFLCIYFYAASLYPGGTYFHPEAKGYSHLNNYWCDLTDHVTYAGVPNPSRAVAVWGMFAFLLSLIFFWYYVPLLFRASKWTALLVRGFGCSAMAVGLLLPFAHDSVINISFLLGMVAFVVALIGLLQNREFKVLLVAAITIVFCIVSYGMWAMSYGLEFLPLVQKLTFLSAFIWVAVTVRRYSTLVPS